MFPVCMTWIFFPFPILLEGAKAQLRAKRKDLFRESNQGVGAELDRTQAAFRELAVVVVRESVRQAGI